jgi:hypothetical protein
MEQQSTSVKEVDRHGYQIKELKHVDVAETLLRLDLFGAADILIFGVPVAGNSCAVRHQVKM